MFEKTGEIAAVAVVGLILITLLRFIYKILFYYVNKSKTAQNNFFPQHVRDFCPDELCNVSEYEVSLRGTTGRFETFTVDETDEFGVDLARANYLNMLNSLEIKEVAIECIRKYGVGTCGPRAFFGTTEVHLDLESQLASYLGMEEAIIYSYGFAAPSNSIMAYCRKNNVIFCDEKINFALRQGMLATKAIVIYFKHNSVYDLREKLEEVTTTDSPMCNAKKFLLIEGIYAKTGTVCPLPEFIKIAKLYKMRIFVDESISFGVLGEKGRGVTEHYGVSPNEVDLIIGSLEGAIGSIGSFCVSSKSIIEQQRLSSTGYIFSASLPTFQAEAAIIALTMLERSHDDIFRLQLLSRKVHRFLNMIVKFVVHSDPISPYKVFNYRSKDKRLQYEREICEYCRSNGVYLISNENGLIMHLNVALYYDNSKLMDVFSVLECAANSCSVV